jgi:hypothetical protein
VRHIVFGDDQVIATIILPPDDDVGVGMSGVVVVDSNPIELRAKVNLSLGHESAEERLEVSKFCTILRRDNQPKLVAVTFAFSKEPRTVGIIEVTAVKLSGIAFRCHPIPLNVTEMGAGCPKIAALELGDPRLDNDAAISANIETSTCQSSEGTAAPDPRSREVAA